jgi:hypothetical protein
MSKYYGAPEVKMCPKVSTLRSAKSKSVSQRDENEYIARMNKVQRGKSADE